VSPLLRPLIGRVRPFVAAAAKEGGAPAKQGGAKKGRGKKDDDESGPYSPTVTLPATEFSARANAVVREPQIQGWWAEQRVYESLAQSNPGAPYTLHDGPPYANGDLHIGHALNKVLKDVINRYQLLRGRKARFVPGWDTHGLPIELKVLQSLPEAERKALTSVSLRQKAKEYALKTIEAQKAQFKRYGVWADWGSPYVTLDPAYEAAQLAVFGKMLLNGHIYRGRKPVHWSPSSRTALAEAELEYPEGHKSRSIYVAMPITTPGPNVPPELTKALEGAGLAIWTTTPWTIPANLAVAVNGDLAYCVVEAQGEDCASWSRKKLVVAHDLVGALSDKWGAALRVVGAPFKGAVLEGTTYTHPLAERASPVVIGGDYITTETGTGLVHTAPGHGQEDYQVGQRYGLPLLSPVDDAGRFTAEAGPRFEGKNVQGDGNAEVVVALGEAGVLLKEEAYEHKYPYDWRTKKPTIFRATSQWFASVSGFRDAALDAIRAVSWVPAAGEARITSMTEGRSDWCISRQRKWGVPIPVFYDIETDEPLMSEATISHVTALVAQHGSDVWWAREVADLLPDDLKHLAPKLRKGEDTMDVWFDSGSSWAGVLQANAAQGLSYPADLYLEGSDQHRGWFQSSLLTSVAANGMAPYKAVLTHGFVLDERGAKMSKSLGNVVDPRVVIEGGKDEKKDPPYGADVLRLWVASVDYSSDVMIGPGILKQVSEVYRKLRGTLRFLLGNLAGFDPTVHSVAYESLPSLDKFMLYRLAQLQGEIAAAYDSYSFAKIYTALQRFVVQDLSNFYLDVAKDRQYIRAADDPSRRACQTVMYAITRALLAALAPVTPHMAEDAWLAMGPALRGQAASVFQAGWAAPEAAWSSLAPDTVATWGAVLAVRNTVNVTLEKARNAKALGASLEAKLALHVGDDQLAASLARLNSEAAGELPLRYVFLVSQVEFVGTAAEAAACPFTATLPATPAASASADAAATAASSSSSGASTAAVTLKGDITVGVSRASGTKCARCWNFSEAVGTTGGAEYPDLCERCTPIVKGMGFKPISMPASPAAAAKQPVGAAQ